MVPNIFIRKSMITRHLIPILSIFDEIEFPKRRHSWLISTVGAEPHVACRTNSNKISKSGKYFGVQVLFGQCVSVLLGLTTHWAQFDTLSVFERWKIVTSQACWTQNLALNVSYCWNWKPHQNFPRQVENLKFLELSTSFRSFLLNFTQFESSFRRKKRWFV